MDTITPTDRTSNPPMAPCHVFDRVHEEGKKKKKKKEEEEENRSCSMCKTTTTPQWRPGPAGPKSLCNKCGIRHRRGKRPDRVEVKVKIVGKGSKRAARRAGGEEEEKEGSSGGTPRDTADAESLKERLMAVGEVLLQRPAVAPPSWLLPAPVKRPRSGRRLREEYQAAMQLLALSCHSLSAA